MPLLNPSYNIFGESLIQQCSRDWVYNTKERGIGERV